MTIKLRDKRTGKEVFATVEKTYQTGYINKSRPIKLSPPGGATRFEIEYDQFESTYESETEVDDCGDRVFLIADDQEEVPERFLEPFCDGMSVKKFVMLKFNLEFVAPISALQEGIHEEVHAALDHVDDCLPGSRIYMRRETHPTTSTINATEMAMVLRDIEVDPKILGIGPEGQAGGQHPPQPRKVSHGDEYKGHPIEAWRAEVVNDETRLGYRAWVDDRVEKGDDTYCRTCLDKYDDGGDGYDGECPDCADKTEAKRLEESADVILDVTRTGGTE